MMTFVRTERDEYGHRVDVYRTTDAPQPECPLCQVGACEQQVHVCAEWKGDLIVHDKPALVH
jgi:hypothetical protein